VTRHCP